MQHHHAGIEFVVARVKRADYRHLLQARHHAGRRHLPAGCHQGYLVADLHAQTACQLHAQHGAKAARLQLLEHLLVGGSHIGHLGLQFRLDAAHQHAAHVFAMGDQRLAVDKGGGPHHLGLRLHALQQRRHILQAAAIHAHHLDVRHHAQHAVAHFLLEAVHDRQHDDQRRNAQRNADDGRGRNERDEPVAAGGAAGARIAPAQQ